MTNTEIMKKNTSPTKKRVTRGNDNLHELIHTMSASEKRYFIKHAKKITNNDGTSPDYLELFGIMNRMDTYDDFKAEQKLLKAVKKEYFSNFAEKKKELYAALMRQLKNYHAKKLKKSADYIKVLIQDANFLFKRGLYRQANKYLMEARGMAEECGDTLSLIEINRFEREYMRSNRALEMEERMEFLHAEEERLIEDLKVEAGLIQDYDYLINLRFVQSNIVNKENIDRLKKEFKRLEDLMNKNDLPILAERFLLNSLSDYCHLVNKNELVFEVRQRHYNWWKKNSLWRNQLPHNYINSLSNLLGAYHRKREYNKFPELLKKLEKVDVNNKTEEARRFQRLINYRLLYYMNIGLIDEACRLSNFVEKGFKKYNLSVGVRIALIFNLISAHFLNEDSEKCIYWINFYKPFKTLERGKLYVQFAQILKIISLYELGEFDQFDNTYNTVFKYFKNHLNMELESFEIVIIGWIKKMSKAIPSEQVRILKEIKNYVLLIQSNPETYRRIGVEELLFWVDSKLTSRSMKDLLIESNKKRP